MNPYLLVVYWLATLLTMADTVIHVGDRDYPLALGVALLSAFLLAPYVVRESDRE